LCNNPVVLSVRKGFLTLKMQELTWNANSHV
jgi:hypothetical protein